MPEEGDAESHKTEFFPLCQVTGRWDLHYPCKYEYEFLSSQKIHNLESGQNICEQSFNNSISLLQLPWGFLFISMAHNEQ